MLVPFYISGGNIALFTTLHLVIAIVTLRLRKNYDQLKKIQFIKQSIVRDVFFPLALFIISLPTRFMSQHFVGGRPLG